MTPAQNIQGGQSPGQRSVSHSWGNNIPASPTATFHSPPGSWGGLTQRVAAKQLKPFKTQDIKILLLENVNKTGQKTLQDQGYQVEALKTSLSEDELIDRIRWVGAACKAPPLVRIAADHGYPDSDVHVIGIRSKTKLTEKVLHEAKNLLVIGCFCIGTNQVDLEFAARHGIAVFNSPFANSRSVAELVIAEIITLARQLGDRSNEMHRGMWNKVSSKCWEIRGKTLGKPMFLPYIADYWLNNTQALSVTVISAPSFPFSRRQWAWMSYIMML